MEDFTKNHSQLMRFVFVIALLARLVSGNSDSLITRLKFVSVRANNETNKRCTRYCHSRDTNVSVTFIGDYQCNKMRSIEFKCSD
jgi:hypothetical protein